MENEIKLINPMIKTELVSTLISFVNEIELVFDYINNEYVIKLRDLTNRLNNTDDANILDFAKSTYNSLNKYESDLSFVIMGKHKIKKTDYDFLNELILFEDILNFNLFKDENKNTKRTIVNYLYNIYMSCFILSFGAITDNDSSEFSKNLIEFVEKLQRISKEKDVVVEKKKTKNKNKSNSSKSFNTQGIPDIANIMNNLNANPDNLSGLDNMFQSLMSNNELMSIANDLSKDIQTQDIDPMTLLSSMMSGKPNKHIQKLVNDVTQKIETKINSGEIDKTVLEIQAKNILESMPSNIVDKK